MAIIFELVIASEGNQGSKPNSKWPVYLSRSVDPYLRSQENITECKLLEKGVTF